MNEEQLNKEIEYVYSYHGKELARSLNLMEDMIYSVSNSLAPLATFLNDYKHFYYSGKIDEFCFNYAVNDLYLMALQLKLHLVEGGIQ